MDGRTDLKVCPYFLFLLSLNVIARSVSDVAISVVGGNAEIATSFGERTRNDRKKGRDAGKMDDSGLVWLEIILSVYILAYLVYKL